MSISIVLLFIRESNSELKRIFNLLLNYTFCSVFLFSLPILFEALSVLHTYLECQMIFDCSAAGDFVSQHVDCFVIDVEGLVAVGIGGSAAEGFVWSGAKDFGGAFLADYVDHHPSPLFHVLLHFCKWGNVVPMSIFLWLVWAWLWHWGLLQFGVVLLF